jgi:hypothetical protein
MLVAGTFFAMVANKSKNSGRIIDATEVCFDRIGTPKASSRQHGGVSRNSWKSV